jgi:signal transduction histidine kinase
MMTEGRSRVLVIDDNPKNLDVLSELLEQQDLDVLFAVDGTSGLQCAVSGHPDLILLDIMMPGLDGFETCRQLKANENTKDIPVIFMTALSETTEKVKGFERGAVDYITKPIEPEEVLARVNTHLTIQRLQQDLKRSFECEKELNRLKSRFLAIASHEFRSPLIAIQMTTNTLKRHGQRMSLDKKIAAFERIERGVKFMSGILDDVLIISKVDAEIHEFSPKPTDIESVCREVIEEFRAMNEGSHTLTLSVTGEHFHLIVDQKLLRYIFSNLLANAMKYSPEGGAVHVDLIQKDQEILLCVKDEGMGISKEDQLHLFDAFHRGANVSDIQGTGLGLSIVKQFVELHNGSITVESELNKGATFTVILPIP